MTGKKMVVVTQETVEESPELSFEELCEACHVSPDLIHELIEYGILEPEGESQVVWRFHAIHLRRARTAVRLQHDLEVNLAGIALALDLMDEMEQLRAKIALLEKHFI